MGTPVLNYLLRLGILFRVPVCEILPKVLHEGWVKRLSDLAVQVLSTPSLNWIPVIDFSSCFKSRSHRRLRLALSELLTVVKTRIRQTAQLLTFYGHLGRTHDRQQLLRIVVVLGRGLRPINSVNHRPQSARYNPRPSYLAFSEDAHRDPPSKSASHRLFSISPATATSWPDCSCKRSSFADNFASSERTVAPIF